MKSLLKEKKIALLIPSLDIGGAERVAVSLANSFDRQGLIVDLIVINKQTQLFYSIRKTINVIFLEEKRSSLSLVKLIRAIKKSEYFAIISFLSHVNIVAVLASKVARYKGRVILTEHSSFSGSSASGLNNKERVLRFLMKRLYKYAYKVVGVSESLSEEIISATGLNNVVCIYNPVTTDFGSSLSDNTQQQLHANSGSFFSIIAVGRLTKAKNFGYLIRTILLVSKNLPVKLFILGDGEERESLASLIKQLNLSEIVFLLGNIMNPAPYYKKADLFVSSSAWEGFSLVIAEALAFGVTVVSTDCPVGPAEILENGKWGYLAPLNDEEEFCRIIIQALKNPMDPEPLIERSMLFSEDNIARQYLDLVFKS